MDCIITIQKEYFWFILLVSSCSATSTRQRTFYCQSDVPRRRNKKKLEEKRREEKSIQEKRRQEKTRDEKRREDEK